MPTKKTRKARKPTAASKKSSKASKARAPSKTRATRKTSRAGKGRTVSAASRAGKPVKARKPSTKPSKRDEQAEAIEPVRPSTSVAPETDGARPGSERARDQQRDGGPRYAGGPWDRANEPPEGKRPVSADEETTALGDEESSVDDSEIEGGGLHEGMGRAGISRNS